MRVKNTPIISRPYQSNVGQSFYAREMGDSTSAVAPVRLVYRRFGNSLLLALAVAAGLVDSGLAASIGGVTPNWYEAGLQLKIDGLSFPEEGAAKQGDAVRYSLEARGSGHCYIIQLNRHKEGLMMRPPGCRSSVTGELRALYPAKGSLSVDGKVGVERVIAILSESPVKWAESRLLRSGATSVPVRGAEEVRLIFTDLQSAAALGKLALVETSFLIDADDNEVQFTTRGIVREVMAAREEVDYSSDTTLTSFDVQLIQFEVGSDIITPAGQKQVAAFGAALLALELEMNGAALGLRIIGHTDSAGSAGYNDNLSQQRAISVSRYLTSKLGIPQEALEVQWRGESMPDASNDTDEGRARNRRVEMVYFRR